MKTNLDQIIDHWENEKLTLEDNIKQSIKEWDYISASHYASAIKLINQKLKNLGKIDPLHRNEIKHLEQRIETTQEHMIHLSQNMDKELPLISDEKRRERYLIRFLEYSQNQIKSFQKQIEQLKTSKPSFYCDNQIIDEAISKVLEKEINGFKLYLDQSDNFYFKCTLSADSFFLIETPEPTEFDQDKWLFWSPLKILRSIGFEDLQKAPSFILQYSMSVNSDPQAIKRVLARVLFEAFEISKLKKDMAVALL